MKVINVGNNKKNSMQSKKISKLNKQGVNNGSKKPKGRTNYCKNLFRDEERTERLIKEAKEEMEVIRDEEVECKL